MVDEFFLHVCDLGECFARQQPCLVQALRRQLDRIGDVGARVSLAVLVRVLHHVGELGPEVFVREESAEQILRVERAEVVVEDAEAICRWVAGVGLVEASQTSVPCQDGRGALRACLDEMWETSRHVHDGCEIPFLVRGFQVPSSCPIDRDCGFRVIPHVVLALVEAVLRPDGQSRSGSDGDLGLRGRFDGGDLGLVAHLDADDGAELAAFGEAADEAVAKDFGEF